jgi:hypothetical protein
MARRAATVVLRAARGPSRLRRIRGWLALDLCTTGSFRRSSRSFEKVFMAWQPSRIAQWDRARSGIVWRNNDHPYASPARGRASWCGETELTTFTTSRRKFLTRIGLELPKTHLVIGLCSAKPHCDAYSPYSVLRITVTEWPLLYLLATLVTKTPTYIRFRHENPWLVSLYRWVPSHA